MGRTHARLHEAFLIATIASVSVAMTWGGDDDQGLPENGPILLDHCGELGFRKIAT